MGEVKVGDGFFGPFLKGNGRVMRVDENINEEEEEHPQSSDEHFSSVLKQPEKDP